MQVNTSTWTRGQKVMAKKTNDYFSRDEEDQASKALKMNKSEVLAAFQQAVTISVQGQQSAATGAAASAETKSLFEMITERDAQITQLSQMQDIQNSEMIDALTQDVATAGSSTVLKSAHVLQSSIMTTTTDVSSSSISVSQVSHTPKVQKQAEYNPEFDLEKLQKEKEEQISGYVELLKTSKQQIDQHKVKIE
jgi:hypothetical protein